MKPRTLGFGFFILSIYLLGMYAIASFLLYQSNAANEFTVRLAFIPKDLSVLDGMQLFIGVYVILAIFLFCKPRQTSISKLTSVSFWMLACSTFLFGIKLILLTVTFILTARTHFLTLLAQSDWMYQVFEWTLDLLFYLSMILFIGSAILRWRKRKESTTKHQKLLPEQTLSTVNPSSFNDRKHFLFSTQLFILSIGITK